MELTLVHLYPDLMNIYGDRGNVEALSYRCQKRGIKLKIKPTGIGLPLPKNFDLLFAGGGQDRQQGMISKDLLLKKPALFSAHQLNIPFLVICGSYQLFGRYFQPFDGPKLPGIGLFPIYTVASKQRKIGNILVKTIIGDLVGFENHSGSTYLDSPILSLGKVIKGYGNNGQDKTEGCRVRNSIGTYLHGPLLPKNPHLADYLIKTALEVKYRRKIRLTPLNDELEWRSHRAAVKIC